MRMTVDDMIEIYLKLKSGVAVDVESVNSEQLSELRGILYKNYKMVTVVSYNVLYDAETFEDEDFALGRYEGVDDFIQNPDAYR
jgi:hypothetical protein